MALKLYIDKETRSAADLRVVGVHAYAQHETTSILCLGFAFDQEPVRIVLGRRLPQRVIDHVVAGGKVVAHNAAFELTMWNLLGVPRFGWPRLEPTQVSCTMVRSYAMGLPGSLERSSAAAGLSMAKDMKGNRLMLKLCKPREIVDGTIIWWEDPADYKALYRYCAQDIEVERALDRRLLELSPKEKEVWIADQTINDRGILVAKRHARIAKEVVDKAQRKLNDELRVVSGNQISSYNAHAQIKKFLRENGIEVPGVGKAEVSTVLERRDLSPAIRRVLEIRQEAAKSSTKKLEAMIEGACSDDRMRGILQYHAAGTGRWGGRRLQPQNFPKPKMKQTDLEDVFATIDKSHAPASQIAMWHGSVVGVVSECLRGFLIAPPGKKLVAVDYNSVEARVLAWLANEEASLVVFRGDGKIYEKSASDVFGRPAAEIKKGDPHRDIGKVVVLSMGFQGGVGALQAMAKNYGVKMEPAFEFLWDKATRSTKDYALRHYAQVNKKFPIKISKREWLASELIKLNWREKNPNIVEYWAQCQAAAMDAIRHPGEKYWAGAEGREVTYLKKGSFLFCRLPSGRSITYAYPSIKEEVNEWGFTSEVIRYMAMDNTRNKWRSHAAYGGLLVENNTQATARDLLAEAIVFLEKAHWPVVLHVHDEVVSEVDERESLSEFEAIVGKWAVPEWAAGLPMAVEGWEGKRYRK